MLSRLLAPAWRLESGRGSAEDGAGEQLEARLLALGCEMHVMEGDGNCQFRSAAFNLFGSQEHHAVVRASAVEHMRRHADFFGMYFEGHAEFAKYLREMGRSRTWGDELTLRAIVEVCGCESFLAGSS